MNRKIPKTYKVKLRLTKDQEERLDNWIGTCRFIYNLGKEVKECWYSYRKKDIHKFELMKQITPLKKEYDWIKDVPAGCLQQSIEQLYKSFAAFYKGSNYPKWARKDKFKSITFTIFKVEDGELVSLTKLGKVRTVKDRKILGDTYRVKVIKQGSDYFACVYVWEQQNKNESFPIQKTGIDAGIARFATLSDGTVIENPRHFLQYQKRLRIQQRSLARKKPGSNNRNKQKQKLAKLHQKIRNMRQDFLHKQSRNIIDNYGFIAVEDLNVKGMVKNHNLAKHISDASWSQFFRKLEYKSNWYGNTFIKVNPKHTSQKCNSCGHIDANSRISQSEFKCVGCGHEDNADLNAAKNILGQGMADYREREALACA